MCSALKSSKKLQNECENVNHVLNNCMTNVQCLAVEFLRSNGDIPIPQEVSAHILRASLSIGTWEII